MHSSKKGNQWYFGMKAHVGVDASSGLVHTVGVTSGNVHDAKVMDRLVRDDDTAVYGDKGYASDAKKHAAEATGVLWEVKEKAKPGGRLTARQRARNRRVGKVRAKVEHRHDQQERRQPSGPSPSPHLRDHQGGRQAHRGR